jgi:hypothetical protein
MSLMAASCFRAPVLSAVFVEPFAEECNPRGRFRLRINSGMRCDRRRYIEEDSHRSRRQTAFSWRIKVERAEQWCTTGVTPGRTIVWLLGARRQDLCLDNRYKQIET